MNPPNISRNLGPGSTGSDVQALQEWLKSMGYFPANTSTTQYYGDITKNAVAAWQKAVGIDAGNDAGWFGPKSMSKVQGMASQPANNPPVYQEGSVVNGNVLGPDGQWRPVTGSGTGSGGTVSGGSPQTSPGGTSNAGQEEMVDVQTGSATNPVIKVPKSLANDPNFQALTPDNKATVAFAYSTMSSGGQKNAKDITDALQQAAKTVDPYFAEKIRLVTDTLSQTFSTSKADLAAKERDISQRKKQIEDDLTYNKQYLTAEQQAELKRQADQYSIDLQNTRDELANRGISSSSIANQAIQRLDTNNTDIITSTNRKYSKSFYDLQSTADAQNLALNNQLSDAQRANADALRTATRNAEALVGSSALGTLPDVTPYELGNIGGSYAVDKTNKVIDLAGSLINAGSKPTL